MSEILVNIENPASRKHFITLLKDLKYIDSFKEIKYPKDKQAIVKERDWIRPGEHALDEEILKMIETAENSQTFSLEEAKSFSKEHLSQLLR